MNRSTTTLGNEVEILAGLDVEILADKYLRAVSLVSGATDGGGLGVDVTAVSELTKVHTSDVRIFPGGNIEAPGTLLLGADAFAPTDLHASEAVARSGGFAGAKVCQRDHRLDQIAAVRVFPADAGDEPTRMLTSNLLVRAESPESFVTTRRRVLDSY